MNYHEAARDIRHFIQREFYLEGNTEDRNKRMQDSAARYAYEKYPELKKCVVTVDYFGEIKLDIA
jgi:hypothetical protein